MPVAVSAQPDRLVRRELVLQAHSLSVRARRRSAGRLAAARAVDLRRATRA